MTSFNSKSCDLNKKKLDSKFTFRNKKKRVIHFIKLNFKLK